MSALVELAERLDLGTRCAAQQVVLGRTMRFHSWRDVDAEIKKVEREIAALRARAQHEGGDNG